MTFFFKKKIIGKCAKTPFFPLHVGGTFHACNNACAEPVIGELTQDLLAESSIHITTTAIASSFVFYW